MSTMRKTEYGFSLLELLAVMSIMGLLTTVAVTSYFGAARGMARRSAVKHLVTTLTVARQRACMDNARVSVVFYNEVSGVIDAEKGGGLKVVPSYVVCKAVGKISMVSGDYLIDEFNALDKMFSTEIPDNVGGYRGGFRLYNLSEGEFSFVYPWVVNSGDDMIVGRQSSYQPRSNSDTTINAWCFEINQKGKLGEDAGIWNVGDSYGVESAPVQSLPKSFLFGGLNDDEEKFEVITFLPSGRVIKGLTIKIEETRPPKKSTKITVNQDGKINYNGKW